MQKKKKKNLFKIIQNKMKKFIYILIAVLGFNLVFNLNAHCQSDAFCNGASPFCTGTTYNFPLNTGTSSEAGPAYGCLGTQPNPVWYFLQIDQPGNIDIHMQSTPSQLDVDFICWGPFTSATGACTAGLTAGNTVDCSYSSSYQEDCNISNALTGQFYMLLITNYSNQSTNVAFSQTNTGQAGAGTTDCSVMTPCNIITATANPSACSPGPNTYSVSGTVTFVNAPAAGTLVVTDGAGATQTLNMPFSSPMSYNLTGLTSNSASHTIHFAFSGDPFCVYDVTYTAPAPCNTCNADPGIAQSVCGLSTAMAAVVQPGDYNMSWSYTGGVAGVSANNPASPTAVVSVPAPGSYTFTWTITNQFGITCSDSVTIKFTNPPTSTFSFTPIMCFDNNTTTLAFTGTASSAATYTWNYDNGIPTGNDVTWTTAGNHVVSLTVNEFGCPPSITTNTITTPPDLITNVDTIPVLCNSGTNGSVIISVVGGVAFSGDYNYNFSNCNCPTPPTTAASYTVTITDDNGCFNVEPFTITQPQPLTVLPFHTNLLCNNDASGTASVNVTGGTPGYTYSWSNNTGLDNPLQTGLQAGSYTVSITDINGCLATTVIVLVEPPLLTVSLSNLSDASCAGVCDGTATALGTGGTSPIAYNWGTTTSPINNTLCVGSTIVTITDANGCTVNATAVISEPTLLTATITNQVNELCFGGIIGSATVTAGGGTPVYQYSWTTGSPNQTINNLAANPYGVIVTDANGCTEVASVTITQPAALGVLVIGTTDISCNGVCDGTANVIGDGGTSPYSYNWGVGQDTSALCAGTHTVIVTDANGCTSSTTINTFQPTPVVATISDTTSVSCFGGNNGDATVVGSGGTPGYTYVWNAGSSTTLATNTGLSATTYSVTVYDSQNCSGSTTATITEPTILNASAAVTSNYNGYSISCFGLSDANIDLLVTGGSIPYTYTWSNLALSQDLTGVAAGTYSVTVTDAHGCIANTSISTTEPPKLLVSIANISSYNGFGIRCAGLSDGKIDINVSGGVPVLSFLWSNDSTSQNLLNVAAGNYSVVVTDENGCTANIDTTLTEPIGLSVSHTVTNVNCYGFSSGGIDFSVSNGVPVYSYMWSNAAITQDLGNIISGIYSVVVSDANNCLIFDTIVVSQPPQLSISVSENQLICSGDSTLLSVVASGGTVPYFYFWPGQPSTSTIIVAPKLNATYSVFVVDNNGCHSDTGHVILNVMPPVVLTMSTDRDSVCLGSPVYITAFPSGGDGGPYTLYYQNQIVNDFPIELYPSIIQNYVFTATDHTCITFRASDTIIIKVLPNPQAVFLADKYAGCVPFTVTFHEALNVPGTSYEWIFHDNGAVSDSHYPVHTFEVAGVYDITLNVTDKNGCQGSKTNPYFITSYPKPEARFNYSPEMVSIISPVITFTNMSMNAASYYWSFGDGDSSEFSDPIHTYHSVKTFEIYLFAISDHGCIDSTKAQIVVRDEYAFYAPSAFSPDLDGVNDEFIVFGRGIDPAHFKLTVSDRWGQLLFETNDPNTGWNGKYMNTGGKIANGTYVWMVGYQDLGQVIHQKAGYVTLIK